ncbi:MAG: hypothetical protein WCW04_03090 [Candidatus Paceibacterota bacterium]
MSTKYYKGYKVGSLEKGLLKLILNIKDNELPNRYDESFSDIFKTARQKLEYSNNTKRMVQKGLLRYKNKNGEIKLSLTEKGKELANEYILNDIFISKKPNKWDGKWRMVMFDIPEQKTKLRNLIRFHLKRIGFIQIQGSVWIYPYPCEGIITIIKSNFNLEDEVIYIEALSFENDNKIKKVFKLL